MNWSVRRPGSVLIRNRNQTYYATSPAIDAVNPIESGDCLLVGLADARLSALDLEASIRHAIGAAVPNSLVWDAGAIDHEEVKQQGETIEVVSLN